MTRFAIISAIFLTGAFATVLANLHSPAQPIFTRIDESQFDETVRANAVSYYCFKNTLTTTLELLGQGKMPLDEARNRVYEAALHNHPAYLRQICNCEHGATPQDRVARNLIGHLNSLTGIDPSLHVRILALEIEFAELQRTNQQGF